MKKKIIVKTRKELVKLIDETVNEEGLDCNLNFIDTSLITDMSWLFYTSEFSGDIGRWNVSNVENMEYMFYGSKFNEDISKWDVSSVKNMSWMFYGSIFNQDISNWNTGNVTSICSMFCESKFNGDISRWNTGKVKNMIGTFSRSEFNQDISDWNVSHVTNMKYMFLCSKFNGDIGNWDVSSVTSMNCTFYRSKFNKDISKWNTSKVTEMDFIFEHSKFNKDISRWDVKNVITFKYLGNLKEEYLPSRFKNPLIQSKSYIGWKKLRDDLICKLLIPEDAIKLKGDGNKCRASKAKVIDIIDMCTNKSKKLGYSIFDPMFLYRVGEEVKPDEFDLDRWNECGSGIHFFLTKKEAEEYGY